MLKTKMDHVLCTCSHRIISDITILSEVLYIYLTSGDGASGGEGDGEKKSAPPKRKEKVFEVLRMLLNGDWERWVDTQRHQGEGLGGFDTGCDSPPPSRLQQAARGAVQSIISDLLFLPFYSINACELSGVHRSAGAKSAGTLAGKVWEITGGSGVSFSQRAANYLRGATGVCLLGLFRNCSSNIKFAAAPSSPSEFHEQALQSVSPPTLYKSTHLLHGGVSQMSTGRRNTAINDGKRRASGNIYFDSFNDGSDAGFRHFDSVDGGEKKAEVSLFGRVGELYCIMYFSCFST